MKQHHIPKIYSNYKKIQKQDLYIAADMDNQVRNN
jgi:hypothetical protein